MDGWREVLMVPQDKYIVMLLDKLEEDGYAVAAELEETVDLEDEHSEIVDIRTIAALYRAQRGPDLEPFPADHGLGFATGDVPHSVDLLPPVQPERRGDWRAVVAAAATCTILILSGILAGILV